MYTNGGEIEKDVEKNKIRKANGQNSRQTRFLVLAIMQGTAAQQAQTSITQRKLKTCQMILFKKSCGCFQFSLG